MRESSNKDMLPGWECGSFSGERISGWFQRTRNRLMTGKMIPRHSASRNMLMT
jgi:hypothetical protein